MVPKRVGAIAWAVYGAIALLPIVCIALNAFGSGGRVLVLDGRQTGLLVRTLGLGGAVALFSSILGTGIAVLAVKTNFGLTRVILWGLVIQLLVPPHLHAIAWMDALSNDGWLTGLLRAVHLDPVSVSGLGWAVWILVLAYFPIAALFAVSGLRNVDAGSEEVGRFARSDWRVLWRVSIPIALPQIASGAIFVFLLAVADYGVPDLLQVRTYTVEIFGQFSAFFNYSAAIQLVIPLVLVSFGMVLLQAGILGRKGFASLHSARRGGTGWLRLKQFFPVAILFTAASWIVAQGITVLSFALRAGSWKQIGAVLQAAQTPLLGTILFAAAGATVILAIAFPIGYILARWDGRMSRAVFALAIAPLAIPSTVTGLGLVQVWNVWLHGGMIYGTGSMLLVAYAARFAPVAAIFLSAGLAQVPISGEEAALFATRYFSLRMLRIVLPQLRVTLLAAWVVGFVLCLSEIGATLLIMPPGVETLAVRIYSMLHYGAHQAVAGLSLALILISWLPVAIAAAFMQRSLFSRA